MTLRITWRDIYIGQMRENLWNDKPPFACLYRFPHRTRLSIAAAPAGFDKHVFAREHRCDPDMLLVTTDGGESYLRVRDKATTLDLMREWARTIDKALFWHTDAVGEKGLEDDVSSILNDQSKSPTERLAEVAVRLGQGKFRTDLEQEFGTRCAVTGLTIVPVLRASHIVPWRTANHDERRDPNNGLLLSANVDALFDRYLISFRPDGVVMYSSFLNGHDKRNLGPIGNLLVPPSELRAGYLRRHNEAFETLERERRRYAGIAD
ncbi:HNH endonuclease [Burkholderia cenocepacia]|uniref:HNH endonuclease n=1 Tax=Burkholderia cenocepacia TaxID=95486 RepID=UPI002855550D|nr:HNH endonuclease [Burkholderia cenocepacia]MDR8048034.1 HNH endonuclease [Burkholderia cenocepacia]